MTGFIERSSNLFVCKCGNKVFAVGVDLDTSRMDILLCPSCKTAYALEEEEDPAGFTKFESARVLH